MANTYTQMHLHLVFAVKYRQTLIQPEWEEILHKYITGIIQNNGHKLLAINSVPDHIHIFIGVNPKQSVSELMRLIKGDSAEFINKQKLTRNRFQWQEGYGGFTNSHSQIDAVVKYILNQKEHHRKKTFRQEYEKILKDYKVDFNEQYIFKDPADK